MIWWQAGKMYLIVVVSIENKVVNLISVVQ